MVRSGRHGATLAPRPDGNAGRPARHDFGSRGSAALPLHAWVETLLEAVGMDRRRCGPDPCASVDGLGTTAGTQPASGKPAHVVTGGEPCQPLAGNGTSR